MPKLTPHTDYHPEIWTRLKEYYFSHPGISLRQTAARSAMICGKSVKYGDLKPIAQRENWEVERNRLLAQVAIQANDELEAVDAEADNVINEVNNIRRIVYRQIVAASENGLLLTGEFDRDAVIALLTGIPDLKIVKLRPGGVDAQMVNAYMNLLAKSNVRLDLAGGVSGKTSREQALEVIDEADKELDDYYQSLAASGERTQEVQEVA